MNDLIKSIQVQHLSNWGKSQNSGALKLNFYYIHGCVKYFTVKDRKRYMLLDMCDRHAHLFYAIILHHLFRPLFSELLSLLSSCVVHV